MLCSGPEECQNDINKNDNKIIPIFTKDVSYQTHELCRDVLATKRHHEIYVGTPERSQGGLRYMRFGRSHLSLSGP